MIKKKLDTVVGRTSCVFLMPQAHRMPLCAEGLHSFLMPLDDRFVWYRQYVSYDVFHLSKYMRLIALLLVLL